MSTPATILAVGFVHPALLAGLGLAAAPIIIHLLSRRRFRRLEWAAMRLLVEAEKENRRRVRFEQWLLVALRCSAVALLAFLFARPFVQPGLVAALLGERGQVQRIIVLDDSASLAYGVAPEREFDRLRDAVVRLLSWLHQEAADDPVALYLTSRPETPLFAHARLGEVSLDDLRARVERLAPTHLPARPTRVLTRVAEELASAGDGVRADIHTLSDFQRYEWGWTGTARAEAGGSAARRSVFEPLTTLDPGAVRVILIASGDEPRANVAVLDVKLQRPQTVAGLPAVVNARLANFTNRVLSNLVVRLETDEVPLPPVPVEPILPGQQREVALEVTFPEEGHRVLTVSVGSVDAFAADNTRRVAVHVKPALAVLVVNGQPDVDPQRDEVYLLRNALSPAGPFSSGMRAEVIEAREIEGTDLSAYDCVLLCNLAPPEPNVVAVLERFTNRGGGLVVFLGSAVGDAAEYNRVLFADDRGFLPLPLVGVAAPGGHPEGVGLIRTGDHPLTAMFPAGAESLGESVHFWRYYACAEPADSEQPELEGQRPPAVVLARFADRAQTPAIVERTFGDGRVLLFTSTADAEWNDWPRAMDGSYVVTLLELVQYVSRRETQPAAYVAGEVLKVSAAAEEYEAVGSLTFPAGPDESAGQVWAGGPAVVAGDALVLQGPVAERLGVYRVELSRRDGDVEQRPLCVNLEPDESDLARATSEELTAGLGRIGHTFVGLGEGLPGADERARRELWRGLLLLVVLVLLVEQGLAWWFGRPGRRVLGTSVAAGRDFG